MSPSLRLSDINFPNVRKLFQVDPGHILVDCDLRGADAQVVAAEAEDQDLLLSFRQGLDVHAKNAEDMFGLTFTQASPARKEEIRKQSKAAVHGTNYGGSPFALAKNIGWSIHEAEVFQRRWFLLHPGIKKWHERILKTLKQPQMADRAIKNKFGKRMFFTDRIENNFKKALAWIPQGTVAEVTFRAAREVEKIFPDVISLDFNKKNGFIFQVHDSLGFQVKLSDKEKIPEIIKILHISIPYDPPLIIPWGIKTSETSWGDAKKLEVK